MDDTLLISPFTSAVTGTVELPGSKSITARALILAALCSKAVMLKNVLFSDDTISMMNCLEALGFKLERNEANKTVKVYGQSGNIANGEVLLDVGNAGTTARFIPALLALKEGSVYELRAGESMTKRPMKPLLDALVQSGSCEVEYLGLPGFYPFRMKTKGIKAGQFVINGAMSGQFISALMMVAPFASGPVSIVVKGEIVSKSFVQLTEKMMAEFGCGKLITKEAGVYDIIAPCPYVCPMEEYLIEADATAATYFIALVLLIGGKLKLTGLSAKMKQGDAQFLDLVKPMGLEIKQNEDSWVIAKKIQPAMTGLDHNFNDISDTFLTFSIIAPFLKGRSRIKGIGHTRHQECNRMECMAEELRKVGQVVELGDSTIDIFPKPLTSGAVIDTHDDHRIAMSFAILGSFDLNGDGSSWLSIKNPNCCSKTFPNFFDILNNLRIL